MPIKAKKTVKKKTTRKKTAKKKAFLLGGLIEVKAFDDGAFFFTPPSPWELNEWSKATIKAESEKDEKGAARAGAALFDKCFHHAVNLEITNSAGKGVPFDKDTLQYLSDKDKWEVVLVGFDFKLRFTVPVVKNS